ncbi:MAG: efflux RND transporter permease subunit, partial [Bacteroidales bacterium]|nr:efflux RND transporter permease subunit [Bacteroidales bacterium]
MNISEISVKRPTLVVVVFTILVFLGFMSYKALNYELIPKFSSPIFTVVTVYPGAGPTEVENSVSKKIEEILSGLPGLDVIRSISQEGVSIVIVSLKLNTDVDPVVNDAVRKVQSIRSLLPPQVREPSISKISMNDYPVITLSVSADMPASKLNDELNYKIKPAFAKIDGVGEISLLGGTEREIQVNISHQKLDNFHLSILQVIQAIQNSNLDFPAGKISNSDRQTLLRMSAKFSTVADIANLTISQLPDGSLLKLRDIAEIIDAEKEITTLYRVNGLQSVGIQIKKQDEANTVNVCDAVLKETEKLEKQYASSNLKFTVSQDSSTVINDAADSVT